MSANAIHFQRGPGGSGSMSVHCWQSAPGSRVAKDQPASWVTKPPQGFPVVSIPSSGDVPLQYGNPIHESGTWQLTYEFFVDGKDFNLQIQLDVNEQGDFVGGVTKWGKYKDQVVVKDMGSYIAVMVPPTFKT